MDERPNKLIDRITEQTTRQTFLKRVGAGLVALVAASTLGIQEAAASGPPLYCCTGSWCGNGGCPKGSCPGYTWICCEYPVHCGDKYHTCIDCYEGPDCTGSYKCTYATGSSQACPCLEQISTGAR